MAKNSYHIIAKSNGEWSVRRTGAERASGIYQTKTEAEREARNLLKKAGGGELIVHERDGRVSRRDSYGSNPTPPKDGAGNEPPSVKR